MKTHTLITTISVLSLSLSGAVLSYADDEQKEKEVAACCEAVPDEHKNHGAEMAGLATHTSHSIFNVESTWEKQNGQRAPLSQIGGRTQIVAMVYTTCKYACPRILADLKTIKSGLSDFGPKDLGFTLITFDPKRDTVDAYTAYAKKNDLDADTWTFLRGEPGDILELANLLGVKYKKLPDGEFSHSNLITLLKPNGEIADQLNGLGANPAELIDAAKGQLHQH